MLVGLGPSGPPVTRASGPKPQPRGSPRAPAARLGYPTWGRSCTRAVISTLGLRRDRQTDGQTGLLLAGSAGAAARRRGWEQPELPRQEPAAPEHGNVWKRAQKSPGLAWPGEWLSLGILPQHSILPQPSCRLGGQGSPTLQTPRVTGAGAGCGNCCVEHPGEALVLPHALSHRGPALCVSHLCFPPLLAVIQAPGESLG